MSSPPQKAKEARVDKVICTHCDNSKEFEILDGDIFICLECSARQQILNLVSSYTDASRINVSAKYVYDRKIHFKDTINQYCGKQNCHIPDEVYQGLEKQFKMYHLLCGTDVSPKEVRYKNITKDHLHKFVKELGLTKHNENIHLIYYNITGKKPDDISYLEEKLFSDFELLSNTYDKIFHDIDRKNFIHSQVVLFQLLMKYKHPCSKDDFFILKTLDKQIYHDHILQRLFDELGWSYSPLI